MRRDRCCTHRVNPGESTVRAGGLRADSISRPADALRKATSSAAVTSDRLGKRHRTAVLRTTRRQNEDRDTDQGHDAERNIVQLDLHVVASINTERFDILFLSVIKSPCLHYFEIVKNISSHDNRHKRRPTVALNNCSGLKIAFT